MWLTLRKQRGRKLGARSVRVVSLRVSASLFALAVLAAAPASPQAHAPGLASLELAAPAVTPLSPGVGQPEELARLADLPSPANPTGTRAFQTGLPAAIGLLSRDLTDGLFYHSNGTSEYGSWLNNSGASLTIDGDLGQAALVGNRVIRCLTRQGGSQTWPCGGRPQDQRHRHVGHR